MERRRVPVEALRIRGANEVEADVRIAREGQCSSGKGGEAHAQERTADGRDGQRLAPDGREVEREVDEDEDRRVIQGKECSAEARFAHPIGRHHHVVDERKACAYEERQEGCADAPVPCEPRRGHAAAHEHDVGDGRGKRSFEERVHLLDAEPREEKKVESRRPIGVRPWRPRCSARGDGIRDSRGEKGSEETSKRRSVGEERTFRSRTRRESNCRGGDGEENSVRAGHRGEGRDGPADREGASGRRRLGRSDDAVRQCHHDPRVRRVFETGAAPDDDGGVQRAGDHRANADEARVNGHPIDEGEESRVGRPDEHTRDDLRCKRQGERAGSAERREESHPDRVRIPFDGGDARLRDEAVTVRQIDRVRERDSGIVDEPIPKEIGLQREEGKTERDEAEALEGLERAGGRTR